MALDPQQRQTLQQRLTESEQVLRAEIRTSEDQRASTSYADLAGAAPDEGDEANADLFVDVDHALIGMKLAELRAIDRAQQRMRDGSYGECVDCDAAVGYERLLARPTAERCTHCQSVSSAVTPRHRAHRCDVGGRWRRRGRPPAPGCVARFRDQPSMSSAGTYGSPSANATAS
jgi:RNA polymerase-binding transcription factor DksA